MAESASDKLFKFFAPWIVSNAPSPKGEYRMFCPIHEDPETSKTPSASINFGKNAFNCLAPSCVGGMSIPKLKARMTDHMQEKAAYDPFGGASNVSSLDTKRNTKSADAAGEAKPLTEALVRSWHRGLMEDAERLNLFTKRRGLTRETLEQFQIGFDLKSGRFTIPIRDADGALVNVRKYKMDAEASQKMANHLGCGSPPRLFPFAVLRENDEILVVEGELDAMICIQHGIPAVSGTGGAGRWDPAWSKLFEGKRVFISYDNDRDGRVGAKKAERAVRQWAEDVRIVPPLMEENKSDATDFFLAGGTAEQLREAMRSAPVSAHTQPEPELTEVQPTDVLNSMDASTNGKPLSMVVSVTGHKYPTYSIPHKVSAYCTMDAGPKCKGCVMLTDYEGEHEVVIDKRDVAVVARFIENSEERRVDIVRQVIGAQRCSRLKLEPDPHEPAHTVNEVYVATNVDRHNTDRSDYTARRVYVVDHHVVDTNSVARMVGTTWPNPKDARNEFYAWDLFPETTSIDQFHMTPELKRQLHIFQTAKGQRPIAKLREIAEDLSASVTKIRGRERLLMAMDLVFHSVLKFHFEGSLMDRGWLEFIVVGDTRTGKSKTGSKLIDHYRLGHIIGCEGATFAGLIGGVKQVGKEWTIQWGEITINDRRLCLLDEASGLAQEIIGRMSDVRARGVAQVTAIETKQTTARTRLIWISNPRPTKSGAVNEKQRDGIDILTGVIGNPEDIARFDFAMSVRSEDVSSEDINSSHESPDPKYTSDLCHQLVLWAWSRKPEHVVFTDGTIDKVYEGARWLGDRYINEPPLVQGANVKEKILRIAVALAARTFSTDKTGEQVIVTPVHVADAINFLHRIYSYDNFGYYRRSQRIKRNQEVARSRIADVRMWLRENPRVLEFLVDRSGRSFRSNDLEEMAFMSRDEVQAALSFLSDAKMISKQMAQLVIEPILQQVVSEMERRYV